MKLMNRWIIELHLHASVDVVLALSPQRVISSGSQFFFQFGVHIVVDRKLGDVPQSNLAHQDDCNIILSTVLNRFVRRVREVNYAIKMFD